LKDNSIEVQSWERKKYFENIIFPYKKLTGKIEHIYPLSIILKNHLNKFKMLNGPKKNHVTFQIEEIHLLVKKIQFAFGRRSYFVYFLM